MGVYRYRARNDSGKLIVGTLEADDEAEALRQLTGEGLFVVDLRHERSIEISLFKRVKKQDLSIFCRQLATMIGAGIPIVPALEHLARQAEKKALRQSIEQILESLREGYSFHEALERQRGFFPPVMVHSIEAAEISGSLENALEELSEYLAREHELEEKIKSALTYPAVIVTFAVAVLIVLLAFVIPAFQNVMDSLGIPLPLPTRIVLESGKAFRHGWYLLVIFLAAMAYGIFWATRLESIRYRLDGLLLNLPILGKLYKRALLSRFSRSLGTLLRSGVPIMQALEVVARTASNRVVGEVILRARENVREGKGVAGTLEESGLFPPMVIAMVAVGEETGALDSLLAKISAFYDRELEESVRRLSSMVEPVLIVVLGAVVGFIVLSILLPYFQILGNLG